MKTYVPEKEVPVVAKYAEMQPLYDAAWQNYGVQLGYFKFDSPYPDKEPKPGYYAIVCPDQQTISALQKGIVPLQTVLEDNLHRHANETMCYYHSIYLSDMDDRNAFRKVREVEKAIRNVSTAKYAFQEYGYTLPKSIQQITIDKFARYNNIRHAKDLSKSVNEEYERVMAKTVAFANELYNKDKDYSGVKLLPASKSKEQIVDKDYYEKNHIICINEVVSEEFWHYLQEHMAEQPNFRMFKDKKPSLVLKDNSSDKGVKGINIWSAQTEYREYNVGFAPDCAHAFYTWLLDFKLSNLKSVVPEAQLEKDTDHLIPIQLPFEDLRIFDMYCMDNGNVRFAINHGYFGENTPEKARAPIIAIRFEDAPMVKAILKDMSKRGSMDPVYAVKYWREIDKLPAASYANPYLSEYQKSNLGMSR